MKLVGWFRNYSMIDQRLHRSYGNQTVSLGGRPGRHCTFLGDKGDGPIVGGRRSDQLAAPCEAASVGDSTGTLDGLAALDVWLVGC